MCTSVCLVLMIDTAVILMVTIPFLQRGRGGQGEGSPVLSRFSKVHLSHNHVELSSVYWYHCSEERKTSPSHFHISGINFFEQEEVEKVKSSGNLDNPEGGLDALLQASVCTVSI